MEISGDEGSVIIIIEDITKFGSTEQHKLILKYLSELCLHQTKRLGKLHSRISRYASQDLESIESLLIFLREKAKN